MEAKVKIVSVELNHEDLINIFSTALYDNSSLEVLYRKSDYANIPFLLTDTREEVIAKILMGGGEITIIDNEGGAYEEANDVSYYGKKGKNWQSKGVIEMEGYCKYYAPMYKVNLQNVVNGIKTERGYELAKKLLIDEKGDMWTGYGLLQVILFGEEIYG